MKANELNSSQKTVELYNETEQKTMRLIVSNDDYNILKDLEYCGGYRRFELSIADKEKQGKRQISELLNFLDGIFANKALVHSYFN